MPNYKKYFKIPAPVEEIYLALTNPFTVELWTGEKAENTDKLSAEFSMWGGAISGKILELEEDKKIVQQWYFEGQEEASILTIKLHKTGHSSSVEINHNNIPEEAFENISEGWEGVYMGSLQDYFEDDE